VVVASIAVFASGAVVMAASAVTASFPLYLVGAALQACGTATNTMISVQIADVTTDIGDRAGLLGGQTMAGAVPAVVASLAAALLVGNATTTAPFVLALGALAAAGVGAAAAACLCWPETARLGAGARACCLVCRAPCGGDRSDTEALVLPATSARDAFGELDSAEAGRSDDGGIELSAAGAGSGDDKDGSADMEVAREPTSPSRSGSAEARAPGSDVTRSPRGGAPTSGSPVAAAPRDRPTADGRYGCTDAIPCAAVCGVCRDPLVRSALVPVLLAIAAATSLLTLQPGVLAAYRWEPQTVLLGLVLVLVLAVLSAATSPLVVHCLGVVPTLRAAALLASAGFTSLACFPAHPAIGITGAAVTAVSGFGVLAVVATLTKLVDSSRQGRLQTTVSALGALAAVVGVVGTSAASIAWIGAGLGAGPGSDGGFAGLVSLPLGIGAVGVATASLTCFACVTNRADFQARLEADD